MEKFFLAALRTIPGIGAAQAGKLKAHFGSVSAAWRATAAEVAESACMERAALTAFLQARGGIDVEGLAQSWHKRRIYVCGSEDPEYPLSLKNIFQPPIVLFYRGHFFAEQKAIAIVGARRATAYGRAVASRLAEDLAAAGVEVVSGAARGIDTAAHEGALRRGRTTAVLGCGIDVAYPKENQRLLAQIEEAGLIVSEYPPGTPPHPAYFPARNRIISGMCSGVAVVEAALKSGSLITAELALSEGRDLFAVPGSVFSQMSQGCHRLLKEGAKLTESAGDILEEYDWEKPAARTERSFGLSSQEKAVYEALHSDRPMIIDEVIVKTRQDASQIAFILLQLQLRGLVKECAQRCYVRI